MAGLTKGHGVMLHDGVAIFSGSVVGFVLGLIGGGILCLVLAAIGWQLSRGVVRRSPGAAT